MFENSEPDSYDKNDMKEKVNDLVRLHKVMQEKLKIASYSDQIKILTSVPDKCLECVVQNILMSLKKAGGILAKTAPKKGKTITTKTLYLVTNVYEHVNFSR